MKKVLVLLSVVLVFALVLPMFSVIQAEDTLLIYTEQDLIDISNNLSGSYKLANDIFLSNNWAPIGGVTSPFTGRLDGNGFSVKWVSLSSFGTNVGMFGYTSGASFSNLTVYAEIDNSYGEYRVNTLSSTANAYTSTGIITGESKSTSFTNCTANGTIRGSIQVGGISGTAYGCTFTSCKNNATVVGSESVGGICGLCSGTVFDKCINTGDISSEMNVGGICGVAKPKTISGVSFNSISIAKCINTGKINCSSLREGGIVGYVNNSLDGCSFTVSDSYNTGIITSDNENISSAGIIGAVSKKYGTVSATNCYNCGYITNSANSYGISNSSLANISNCYALNNNSYKYIAPSNSAQLLSYSSMCVQNTFSGFDFTNCWEIDSSAEYKYPTLKDNKTDFVQKAIFAEVTKRPYSFYLYKGSDTTVDLSGLEVKIYLSDGTTEKISKGATGLTTSKYTLGLGINLIELTYKNLSFTIPYVVVNDFTEKNLLSGMGEYYPIYSASDLSCISSIKSEKFFVMNDIDCTESTFKGICSHSSPFSGTFIGNNKTITINSKCNGLFNAADNASISGVVISGSVSGTDFAGSLVGYAKNTAITSCTSSAKVSCASSGDVSFLGGLAGYIEITTTQETAISNCTFNGKITSSAKANDSYTGGLIGEIALYDNTSILVDNMLSAGSITYSNRGNTCIGNIIGCIYARSGVSEIEVSSCANYGTISGRNYESKLFIGGIVGDYVQYNNLSKFTAKDCMNIIKNSSINSAKTIYAGGIISQLSYKKATVENCYVLGAYTTSSSSQPYAITTETNFEGTISNCYGIIGCNKIFGQGTTVLNKKQSIDKDSFAGFDFENVWTVSGNFKHPKLKNVAFDESILTTFTEAVAINGTPTVGETLSADKPGYLYQWCRNGEEIPGATDSTYTLTLDDYNNNVSVKMFNNGLTKGYTESLAVNITIYRIESATYTIDETNISKITVGTTVDDLASKITNLPSNYSVKDGGTVLSNTDVIKTGCTLEVTYPDKTDVFELFVLGDINKDGALSVDDAQIIRDYLLGKTATVPEIKTADFNLDGNIDARDSILIKQQAN